MRLDEIIINYNNIDKVRLLALYSLLEKHKDVNS